MPVQGAALAREGGCVRLGETLDVGVALRNEGVDIRVVGLHNVDTGGPVEGDHRIGAHSCDTPVKASVRVPTSGIEVKIAAQPFLSSRFGLLHVFCRHLPRC